MHSGTRCRDGVKALWCCSHLFFGWFLRVPSLHMLVLVRKMFLRIFPVILLLFFSNGKREEKWEGRLRERRMVCKVQKYRTLLSTKNKAVINLKRFEVKLQT